MRESGTDISVCALFGSPREKSNSSRLNESFLSAIGTHSIVRFNPRTMIINPCIACGFCSKSYRCFQNDDTELFIKSLACADILSISFPLFFSGMPGPVKTLFDRTQPVWEKNRSKNIPLKKGYLFITAGSDYKNMFNPAITIVKHFMKTAGYSLAEDRIIVCNNLDNENNEYMVSLGKAADMGKRILLSD